MCVCVCVCVQACDLLKPLSSCSLYYSELHGWLLLLRRASYIAIRMQTVQNVSCVWLLSIFCTGKPWLE